MPEHDTRDGAGEHAGRPTREPQYGDSPKPHGDKLPRPDEGDAGATDRDGLRADDASHDAAGRPADDA